MKQKAITISLIKKNNNIEDNAAEQRMTSLEIAELTGKQHKNVMQAIRNMEPAWEKVTGLKFQLCEKSYLLANGVTKIRSSFARFYKGQRPTKKLKGTK